MAAMSNRSTSHNIRSCFCRLVCAIGWDPNRVDWQFPGKKCIAKIAKLRNIFLWWIDFFGGYMPHDTLQIFWFQCYYTSTSRDSVSPLYGTAGTTDYFTLRRLSISSSGIISPRAVCTSEWDRWPSPGCSTVYRHRCTVQYSTYCSAVERSEMKYGDVLYSA